MRVRPTTQLLLLSYQPSIAVLTSYNYKNGYKDNSEGYSNASRVQATPNT
jgi:hypothetical protein